MIFNLLVLMLLGVATIWNCMLVYEWSMLQPIGWRDVAAVIFVFWLIAITVVMLLMVAQFPWLVVGVTLCSWLFNYYARYLVRYHSAQQMY
jgi:hypothetical protein